VNHPWEDLKVLFRRCDSPFPSRLRFCSNGTTAKPPLAGRNTRGKRPDYQLVHEKDVHPLFKLRRPQCTTQIALPYLWHGALARADHGASAMPQIAVRAGSFGSFLGFGELGDDFFEVVRQDVQPFGFSAGDEDFLFDFVAQVEHGSDPK